MKARIKATGKIIDIYPVEGPINKEQMYKENEFSNLFYLESALDFKDTINWEERRYEIAKSVIPGFIAANTRIEDAAKLSVEVADELIKKLKEG